MSTLDVFSARLEAVPFHGARAVRG